MNEESYGEGLATHSGPESCVIIRKGDGEALTGDMQVGLLSREIDPTPGCRRSYGKWKATLTTAQARAVEGPRAVKDPVHACKHLEREPGDPVFVCEEGFADRIGKSKDLRR